MIKLIIFLLCNVFYVVNVRANLNFLMSNKNDTVDNEHKSYTTGLQVQNTFLKKTTIVLMGYAEARKSNYDIIFRTYGNLSNIVDKIIFIWNNQKIKPPLIPATKVEIFLWRPKSNSLINRYRISAFVRTSSVLTIDDDVLLSGPMISAMLENHFQFPERLIGLDERHFNLKGDYLFFPTGSKSMLIVIGKTMLWNIKYAEKYIDDLKLVDFTHQVPCEDIGMNFLIRNLTSQEPIIIPFTNTRWRQNLNEIGGLSVGARAKYWPEKRNRCVKFALHHFNINSDINNNISHILNGLNSLDTVLLTHASESRMYGNIFSGKGTQQIKAYAREIQKFVMHHQVQNICEIGFAGGHSATLMLSMVPNISYIGFDMWDRPFYENYALEKVRQLFPSTKITIIKGDSTKTVPKHRLVNGKCDIIHVDGAHHAHFPKTDIINMKQLAASSNLLLIDDCTSSWQAVLDGVNFGFSQGLFIERPKQEIALGWKHRGSQKGWCIASYAM